MGILVRSRGIRRAALVSVAVLLISLSMLALAPLAEARCRVIPTIRDASSGYDAGTLLYIDYQSNCQGTIQLKWPDGTVIAEWTAQNTGTGTATVTYQTGVFSPAGTWTAVYGTWSSSTTIRRYPDPLRFQLRALGETEIVVLDWRVDVLGSANTKAQYKFHDFIPHQGSLPEIWTEIPATARRVTMGDFLGDGRAKVATITSDWHTTRQVVVTELYSGLGSGAMPTTVWTFSAGTPLDVAAGDFNRDGRAELAILYYGSAGKAGDHYVDVWTFKGTRLMVLDGRNYFRTIAASRNIFRIAAADLNGDGYSDLLYSNDQYGMSTQPSYSFGAFNFNGADFPIVTTPNEGRNVFDIAGVKNFTAPEPSAPEYETYRPSSASARVVLLSAGAAKIWKYESDPRSPYVGKFVPMCTKINQAAYCVSDPNVPQSGSLGWFSVAGGDTYTRAIGAGDSDEDGQDELFVLSIRDFSTDSSTVTFNEFDEGALGLTFPPATSVRNTWQIGKFQDDLSGYHADIAAGDTTGDGLLVRYTGRVETVNDVALIAVADLPPYVPDLMTTPSSQFGALSGSSLVTRSSVMSHWSVGFTASASQVIVMEEFRAMIGANGKYDDLSFYASAYEQAILSGAVPPPNDGVLALKISYNVYEFQSTNKDVDGDFYCCDAKDVVWISTVAVRKPFALSPEAWNTGSDPDTNQPWSSYPSWISLPGRHTVGRPSTYPKNNPSTYQTALEILWARHDDNNPPPDWTTCPYQTCVWTPVGVGAVPPYIFNEITQRGTHFEHEDFVSIDAGIRLKLFGDPRLGFSWSQKWSTIQDISTSHGLSLSVTGPAFQYDCGRWQGGSPTEYYFEYLPYLYVDRLASSQFPSIVQRPYVLDYAVTTGPTEQNPRRGIGYDPTKVYPVALITSPASGTSLAPDFIQVIGTASNIYPLVNDPGTVVCPGGLKDHVLKSYMLEWGSGSSPTQWSPVSSCTMPVTGQPTCGRVENGIFPEKWDARFLSPGTYTLRLTVKDWGGNVQVATSQVTLAAVEIRFSDSFDNDCSLEAPPGTWSVSLAADNIATVTTSRSYSTPCSVYVDYNPGLGVARVTSPAIGFDPASEYIISLRYFVPSSARDDWVVVADDTRVKLVYSLDSLMAHVGPRHVDLVTIAYPPEDTWHLIEIRAHPSSSNYHVVLNGVQYGPYAFRSSGTGTTVAFGSEITPSKADQRGGIGYWDDVRVLRPMVGPLSAVASANPTSGSAALAVQFSGTATGGVLPYFYSWDFGDGSTSAAQNPSHTYTLAGTYAARLTVRDSASPQGQATSDVTITVQSSFVAAISPSTQTGYNLYYSCFGYWEYYGFSFSGSASGGSGSYSWYWTFPGGTPSSSSSQFPAGVIWHATGTKTVSLIVTDLVTGAPSSATATVTVKSRTIKWC